MYGKTVCELILSDLYFIISFQSNKFGNDTATEDDDYELLVHNITFTPDDAGPKNLTIHLEQDSLIEGTEYFSIMFTATDDDVRDNNSVTTVSINDSDGK